MLLCCAYGSGSVTVARRSAFGVALRIHLTARLAAPAPCLLAACSLPAAAGGVVAGLVQTQTSTTLASYSDRLRLCSAPAAAMLRVFRAALTAPSRLAELLVFCRARVVYRTHAPDLPIAATHSSGVIDSYPIHP